MNRQSRTSDFVASGQQLWREGDHAAATACFRRAMADADPTARPVLARALAAAGNLDDARTVAAAGEDAQSRYLAIQFGLSDRPLSDTLALLAELERDIGVTAAVRISQFTIQTLIGTQPQPTGIERIDAAVRGAAWLAKHAGNARFFGVASQSLAHAVRSAPVGLLLEFGVYHGLSIGQIARLRPDQTVHGFDSFKGLPEDWTRNSPQGAYSTHGRLPTVPANVKLHVGWFADTLPDFLGTHAGTVALAHIDCDLYSSTRTVLDLLGPRLAPGSILVFDDLLGYPGFEAHELQALEEWGRRWRVIGAVLPAREVTIQVL